MLSFDVVCWSHWLQGLTASCCLAPARVQTSCHGNSRDSSLLLHYFTECKTMQVSRLLIQWQMRRGADVLPAHMGTLQQGWMLYMTWQSSFVCLLPHTHTHLGSLSIPLQAGHWVKPINRTSGMLKSKSVTLLPSKITLHKPLELAKLQKQVSLDSTALILPALLLGVRYHTLNFTLSSGHQLIILMKDKTRLNLVGSLL